MAYAPLSGYLTQLITQTGQVASDYYIKFYVANTTTPLSMATDQGAGTLLVKAKFNSNGMPISNPLDDSTEFIPHLNQAYRLVVYTSAGDADANDTASSYVNIPEIYPLLSASNVGTDTDQIPLNSDLGTAALVDTGLLTGNVPLTNDLWNAAQNGAYLTYGGTANAITLTSSNLIAGTALTTGAKIRFKATATNTGATTINVDGLGAVSCVTPTGVSLPANFIRTDTTTECEYDGTNFVVGRKVESGSNSDGIWTRFENGELACRKIETVTNQAISSATGSLFFGTRTMTFPHVFSGTPVPNSSIFRYGTSASWGGVLTVSTTTVDIIGYDTTSRASGTSCVVGYSVTGKWY